MLGCRFYQDSGVSGNDSSARLFPRTFHSAVREAQTAATLKVLTPVHCGTGGLLANTLDHSREARTVRQCPSTVPAFAEGQSLATISDRYRCKPHRRGCCIFVRTVVSIWT